MERIASIRQRQKGRERYVEHWAHLDPDTREVIGAPVIFEWKAGEGGYALERDGVTAGTVAAPFDHLPGAHPENE